MNTKYDPTKAHTITGYGLTVRLDPAQVYPDDPGQGTPAVVSKGRYSSTLECALATGELSCGENPLTKAQVDWLERIEPHVNTWLDAATELARNPVS